ncbi:NAD+ synthase [bacterium]|nr:NAD+ synthase [bacterium]
MKVYLAQINTTVGDLCGNRERILAALAAGEAAGAELVVTPEMALPGYPPQDLLERADFIRAAQERLAEMAPRTGRTALLVGTLWPNAGPGRTVHNAAVLLHEGRVVSWHAKSLLPTYDVFDEDRYFEPAGSVHPTTVHGVRLGVTVCEDIWNELEIGARRRYRADPAGELVRQGAEVVVNLSASPFELGKPKYRSELVRNLALRLGRPVLQVNLVGGNDSLIFDGSSCGYGPDGTLLGRIDPFCEGGTLINLSDNQSQLAMPDLPEPEWACRALVLGLADYARKCGFGEVLLGLSGGIDSALVAVLAARALGPEHVLGVSMPSRYSSEGSVADARALAERLGIAFKVIPIEPMYQAFLGQLMPHFEGRGFDVTEENLQARIRGTLLMALSNKFGWMVVSTGNKSEMATGYATLYGDMRRTGRNWLGDVPKRLVYELARWINRDGEIIPKSTLEKPPSAELRPNQTDQDSLPPYDVVDAVLLAYVEDRTPVEEIITRGLPAEQVWDVVRRVDQNEYKRRQAAPILKLTCKAFGVGRRMPIAGRSNPRDWGAAPQLSSVLRR